MRLTLNGKPRDVAVEAARLTVAELARRLELPAMIVVERNGEIVDRECFAETALADGDVLEIVVMVGGGSR